MKRNILIGIAVLFGVGTLGAQLPADAQERITKIQSLAVTNPTLVEGEINELLKGKGKKDPALLVAIGNVYLNAGKISEAAQYADLAKKVDVKYPAASVLAGDIALAEKRVGEACQLYEQAIYFDPVYKDAYFKYARVYKTASPSQAIEKLEELKRVLPDCVEADQALAEVYYDNNRFAKAIDVYARFIDKPQATDEERLKYAFALFLNQQYKKSLDVTQKGLKSNQRHAAFNRLAMYNNTEMKRYQEAEQAAIAFFNHSDGADYSSLDYRYYGRLLMALNKYKEAVVQYQNAVALDPTQILLWQEIADAYEKQGDYEQAVTAYRTYYDSLKPENQTLDILFQLGRLYYRQGTAEDIPVVIPDQRVQALISADSIFEAIMQKAPANYLGSLWRARTNSALDPETSQGLAKPYYDSAAALLLAENGSKNQSALIECYSYLGYYYLLANDLNVSKSYWTKILDLDPANATAQKALAGIK